MEIMKLNAGKNTPAVELDPKGIMIIEGRSIMDDPLIFFNPIIDWISKCNSKTFTLEMRLEYMNTSSYKMMLILFKSIKKHYNSTNILINWYYETDDEDMLDLGKDIESLINVPVDFYELQVDDE
jgi:hypothetical protein